MQCHCAPHLLPHPKTYHQNLSSQLVLMAKSGAICFAFLGFSTLTPILAFLSHASQLVPMAENGSLKQAFSCRMEEICLLSIAFLAGEEGK